ncbi:DUF4397 domain-containing protein [Mucilaginibacter segetis]|uniref:DUF4397 domain-containing protein n=1 Tax=Mucilaginibacter segetis TaxID=2793071 RepID=A0A934UMD6_9SPHI|nr:DUF4397 domain-containing protein [Mucilaginibacter segetis]MBK0378925.1 DUF4397 domain-containing protein [Mucilaginibacter segetis]
MKRNLFIYIFISAFICCKSERNPTTQIKVINALQDVEKVEVTVKCENREAVFYPQFGTDQSFKVLPSGMANIDVKADGKLILHKEFGLGNAGKYTFLLEGVPGLSKKVNQQTFSDKLHTVFSGAESSQPNSFLPRIILIRDVTKVKSGQSKLRFINAFAGAEPLTLTITDKNNEKINFTQAYPAMGTFKPVSAGVYHLQLKFSNEQHAVIDENTNLKQGYFYTAVLTGDIIGNKRAKLLLLENKSENQ